MKLYSAIRFDAENATSTQSLPLLPGLKRRRVALSVVPDAPGGTVTVDGTIKFTRAGANVAELPFSITVELVETASGRMLSIGAGNDPAAWVPWSVVPVDATLPQIVQPAGEMVALPNNALAGLVDLGPIDCDGVRLEYRGVVTGGLAPSSVCAVFSTAV